MENKIDDKAEPDTEVNAQDTDKNRLENELDASVKLENEEEAGKLWI